MSKQSDVERVVGEVILDECAKALLECVREGDLFECPAGDLAESRGVELPFDEELSAETLAALDTATYDTVEVALSRLRERNPFLGS